MMLATMLAGAALGLCFFAWLLGLDLLQPNAPLWRNPTNDLATMVAGFEAVLREPWSLHPTVTSRLTGQPVSIVYTDSIPWIALLLKVLGLGGAINNVAFFLLLTFVMQPVGMMALLRAGGVTRPTSLVAGALLALLLPAWLIRFPHVALSGHWIILLALALGVSVIRQGLTPRRAAGFVALGAFVTGIHAYHLVPLAACLAGALGGELIKHGAAAWKRVILTGAATTAAVLLSAWLLAYGVGQGALGGASEFGKLSMNLLGPSMPQASALAGQTWNGNWFTGTVDPNGGQWFEGFNYLGGGVLLLVIAAAPLLLERSGTRLRDRSRIAFAPIAFALLVLALWAVGPTAYLGPKLLLDLPKPDWLAPLGAFRAHGRFFWAVAYAVIACTVIVIDRLASRRTTVVLLMAAVALQLFDTGPVQTATRSIFDLPARSPLPASFESEPSLRRRPWMITPTFYCTGPVLDRIAIGQIVLAAIRLDGTSNTAVTARPPGTPCTLPVDIGTTAGPGDKRITVVLNDGKAFGGNLAPLVGRNDCYSFQHGVICGRDLDRVSGIAPLDARKLGDHSPLQKLVFNGGATTSMLTAGWATPATSGVWSLGVPATLTIPTAGLPTDRDLLFEFQVMSFAPPPRTGQTVQVFVNGDRVATWAVAAAIYRANTLTVRLSANNAGQRLRITFVTPDATAIARSGEVPLGIGLQKLTIFE
ncbi:hypothetical protein [uncultured Phenylobacterium sp.]|uniref:hypothetical protein n=1 Tax=uncultured Phenylobacterium sp. TaxID=349273 RepID=UPI0025F04722|nr:hypothetical protein [uncultured Phenylobacterium sp.]